MKYKCISCLLLVWVVIGCSTTSRVYLDSPANAIEEINEVSQDQDINTVTKDELLPGNQNRITNTLFNAKPTSHLSDSITVIGQLQSYPENDTIHHEPKYFRNYVYVEVWGYSPWFSINYVRLIPSYDMSIGIGTGGVPYFRGHTVDGEILNAFIEKQFSLTEKFFIGFGIGGIYEYDRSYDNFLDPFYTKLVLNRYSASLSDDKLYYGLSLYYIEWVDDWSLRPAVKLGFSF